MKEFSLKQLVTYKGVAQEFSVKEFSIKELWMQSQSYNTCTEQGKKINV